MEENLIYQSAGLERRGHRANVAALAGQVAAGKMANLHT
jgi:hypothetical protein